MDRKDFLKSVGIAGFSSSLPGKKILWDDLNDMNAPTLDTAIHKRLYQGPFPVYDGEFPLNAVTGWKIVMTTKASDRMLDNFGMGMIIYIMDEYGGSNLNREEQRKHIEKLAKIPFGQKLYLRINWRDIQKESGRLSPNGVWEDTLEMAEKYNKKIGFRIMLQNPSIAGPTLPKFLRQKIPFTKLNNKIGAENQTGGLKSKAQQVPDYGHPEFQKAWRALDDLLAAKYNGHPQIEFMDTYMYGFWGEGHTYPIKKISFPDHIAAEETFRDMLYHQLKNWDKTPLLTNTQPDFNQVGNDALLAETLRTNNWLRTDTIFIENQQIDEISNRKPWIGAAVEVGMFQNENKREPTANILQHVKDVGANYCSLWRWHAISAEAIMDYYRKYPKEIEKVAGKIGYRIRPSFIWKIEKEGRVGLIFGLVNDGISGVPGKIKLTLKSDAGKVLNAGYLDAGYPMPTGVRQARMWLPEGEEWKGTKLYAEIEVKNKRYPVEWGCDQSLNRDGSLTITPSL